MNAIAQAQGSSQAGPQLDRRRVVAGLVDLGVLLAGSAVLGMAASAAGADGLSGDPQISVLLLAWGLFYYFALESGDGQTLGKKLLKLRVVRADGRPAGMREVAVRTALRVVDGLGAYLVGLIVMMITGTRRQRLGDLAAGTIVVDADAQAEGAHAATAAGAAASEAAAPEASELDSLEPSMDPGAPKLPTGYPDDPPAESDGLGNVSLAPAEQGDLVIQRDGAVAVGDSEPAAEPFDPTVEDDDPTFEEDEEEGLTAVEESEVAPLGPPAIAEDDPIFDVAGPPAAEEREPVVEFAGPPAAEEREPVVEFAGPPAPGEREPVVELAGPPAAEEREPVVEFAGPPAADDDPIFEFSGPPAPPASEPLAEFSGPPAPAEGKPLAEFSGPPAPAEGEPLADLGQPPEPGADAGEDDDSEGESPTRVRSVETVSALDLLMEDADDAEASAKKGA